jgi:hypothetical protein
MDGASRDREGHDFSRAAECPESLTASEAPEKCNPPKEHPPRGLKPGLISRVLRGPEGPLFHGEAGICEFFSSLFSR